MIMMDVSNMQSMYTHMHTYINTHARIHQFILPIYIYIVLKRMVLTKIVLNSIL